MPGIFYMDKAKGVTPAANHNAGTAQPFQGNEPAVTCVHNAMTASVRTSETLTALATGDIHVACCLPAGHTFADGFLLADDLESTTTSTLTFAQLNQDFTDIVAGTELITASTIGQAGGRADFNGVGLRIPAVNYDRWFGVKVVAGGTLVASSVLSVHAQMRNAAGDI